MALLAEEIVEEWLRGQRYFTIRGIKLGVHEIDLLAVKHLADGTTECRHLEVQASMRPVSFISRVPKDLQKSRRAANSAKRSSDELVRGVDEGVQKKFLHAKKLALMKRLWDGNWTRELVINVVKSEEEVQLIERHGVKIHRLSRVISELATGEFFSSGANLVDLIKWKWSEVE